MVGVRLWVRAGQQGAHALVDLSGGHAEHFSFAILEIVDLHTSDAELDEREAHWKTVLMSRERLNAN